MQGQGLDDLKIEDDLEVMDEDNRKGMRGGFKMEDNLQVMYKERRTLRPIQRRTTMTRRRSSQI